MINIELMIVLAVVAVIGALPMQAGKELSKRGALILAACAGAFAVASVVYGVWLCLINPTINGRPLDQMPANVVALANTQLVLMQVTVLGTGIAVAILAIVFARKWRTWPADKN